MLSLRPSAPALRRRGDVAYSVAGGAWHRRLRTYKQSPPDRAAVRTLAAILWAYVDRHERCLAAQVGAERFDVVSVVPPSTPTRDARGALRHVVGGLCWPTRARHRRLLVPTGGAARRHRFDADCFRAVERLDGARVLLVEDLWATGARAQSAACALRAAGAETIALIALGRQVSPAYADIAARLAAGRPLDLTACGREAGEPEPAATLAAT